MLTRPRLLLCLSLLLSAAGVAACKEPAEPVTPPRAVIRGEGGNYSVVPTAAQLPFCLVVEVQDTAARALPLSEEGESIPCDAGKPAGDRSWPLPAKDDPFKVFVIFSDRKLKADTVALQVRERVIEGAAVTPMDLRAPGQVTIDVLPVKPADLRPGK